MTDDQFEQFMAAQLAQIALLQSIETNTGIFARQANPKGNVGRPNWDAAKAHLDEAKRQREPAAKNPIDAATAAATVGHMAR